MSKLDELLNQLCPDGVEYKKVKDIFLRIKRTPITAQKMKEIEDPEGEIRIFAGGKTVINAKEESIPYANITRVPAVLVQSRGVIDVVYYDKPFTFKNEMWAYAHENATTLKFLYYVLKNNILKFREAASGMGSLPQISLPVTEEFLMPLPPLEVQSEIVRILDNFTELTAELTAELASRRKQYEYYRSKLLSFSDDVPMVPLGEIGSVCMCKRILKSQTNNLGGVPFYKIGTFGGKANAYIDEATYREYKTKYNFPKKGDVLISAAGTIGRTVVYDGEPAYFQDSNIVWLANDETRVLNEFLVYCYAMKPWNVSTGGTIARLYNDNILKAKIPVPSLERQRVIVDTLRALDDLCNNLSSGLPAEIEARQKQYEFYRDKLLTFKEKAIS